MCIFLVICCMYYVYRSNNKYLFNSNFLSHPNHAISIEILFVENSSSTYYNLEEFIILRNSLTDKMCKKEVIIVIFTLSKIEIKSMLYYLIQKNIIYCL